MRNDVCLQTVGAVEHFRDLKSTMNSEGGEGESRLVQNKSLKRAVKRITLLKWHVCSTKKLTLVFVVHLNALLRHLPSPHGFPTRDSPSSHPHNPQRKQQEDTLHQTPHQHLPVYVDMNGVEQERRLVLEAIPFYELRAGVTRTPTLLELAWKREKGIVKIVDDSVELLRLVLDVVVDAHELRFARAHAVQLRVNSPSNSHLLDRFIHIVIDHLKRHRRIAHCHNMRIKRECRK